ncbi:MAG: hypothetical protein ACOYLH_09220 [Flavobacteriales bacterium]
MKILIATLFACILNLSILAQDTLLLSPSYSFARTSISNTTVARSADRGFYVIQETAEKNSRLIITAFDRLAQQQNEREIIIPKIDDQDIDITTFIERRDSLVVIGSYPDKEVDMKRAVAFTIAPNATESSTPYLLNSISRHISTIHGLTMSPDSSKYLSYFDLTSPRKDDHELTLRCFDPAFNLIWEKRLEMPYTGDLMQVHEFFVDNEGHAFLLGGKNPEKKPTQQIYTQGGRYNVFYFDALQNRLKEYEISLKDKQVVSAKALINAQGEMIVAGYYSEDYSQSASGTFFFAIQANGGSIKTATYMTFSKDFLQTVLSERQLDKGAEIADIYLDHLVAIQENYYLIGEQFYISERVNTDLTTGRTIIEKVYQSDDIFVTCVSDVGKIQWSRRIRKEQYTLNEYDQCGYNAFASSKGIRFIFNDHSENTQLLTRDPKGNIESWNGGRDATIILVTCDLSGQITRQHIGDSHLIGGVMTRTLGQMDVRSAAILGFTRNRNYRLGVVQ